MPRSFAGNDARDVLTDIESAISEMIADAVELPVTVWACEQQGAIHDPDRAVWAPVQILGQAEPPLESAPPDSLLHRALRRAAQADRVVEATEGDKSVVATRLGTRSSAFATLRCAAPESTWIVKLVESTLARYRSTTTAAELRVENDSFSAQLASDLEELTFLRSMVDGLSSARPEDELTGMAASTLPVLNATVRARCLAFLRLPNPDDPYHAEAAVVEGDEPCDHATLAAIVRRFGPSASRTAIVRNWEADDLPEGASVCRDDDRIVGVRSLVLTPLTTGERMLGWLAAVNRAPSEEIVLESSWQLASDEFGSGEATLMATTASVLATHAANLDLLREKEQLMVSMVRSLVSAIESKDKYTRGHSERVALYTRRIAEEMGYLDDAAENLYLSALLHDVGKIGVADAVLTKDGKLTEAEYAEIARHPDEGWAILCDLSQLRYVLPGVLHHHERWDGRGYPDGLAGVDIPLDGRVMAVADAFDAMTSDRPYRKGMPIEKAEAILRDGAGTQWDPQCVDAFFACREDLYRLKNEYLECDRKARERTAIRDADEPLPHEVAGVQA